MKNKQNNDSFILMLKEIADKKNINQSKIAIGVGCSRSTIKRIFDLEFSPKLDLFLEICRVLEHELIIKEK